MALSRNQLYYFHQLSHEQIDDWLGENESHLYPESKAQHLGKLHEFIIISKLFVEHHIEFIPLKGPVLSYRIYDDPLYRSFNDLDFLLSPNVIQKALDVLANNGYVSPFFTFPNNECRRKILFQHVNQLFLYHPEKEIEIELHWNLFKGDFVSEKTLNQIIESNQFQLKYQGLDITAFSVEFELLYLIIHGGLHQWSKLKWLIDIKDLQRTFTINESRFLSLTNTLNAHRLVAVCNELLSIYFPGTNKLPCRIEAPKHLLQFSLKKLSRDPDEKENAFLSFIETYRNSISAFSGLRYKFSVIRRLLFATDLASKKWIPCLPFIYYLISPFWKIRRGFR